MSVLDGKQHVATEEQCRAAWSGGRNGLYFRCSLCGHKFVPGDKFRFVMTNHLRDVPGGNPKVCEACDGTDEEVHAKWRAMHDEWKGIRIRFWEFLRDVAAEGGQEALNYEAQMRRKTGEE